MALIEVSSDRTCFSLGRGKLQIAQKYSTRCVCGSSYHQVYECPYQGGWKPEQIAKYTAHHATPQPVQTQQFAMLTPAYNGGAVYCGVIPQQQHVAKPHVQALGIQNKIVSTQYSHQPQMFVAPHYQPQVFTAQHPVSFVHHTGQVFVHAPHIYCRARGCTSCTTPGQMHHCRNCGDTNSDHRAKNCKVPTKAVLINGILYRF